MVRQLDSTIALPGHPARPGIRGFTLIELIVSLGIIMVLAGLLLPALGGIRAEARTTRMLAAMRSGGMALSAYADDRREVYPIAEAGVGGSMLRWHRPIVDAGYLPREEDSDPDGYKTIGESRVSMSGCLASTPEEMVPGATIPIDLALAKAVRVSDVSFPSSKGVLVQWLHVVSGTHVFWTYNPDVKPISPITYADGSVARARCTDFILEQPFFENWVGHPVLSTWNGCRGIDRVSR